MSVFAEYLETKANRAIIESKYSFYIVDLEKEPNLVMVK